MSAQTPISVNIAPPKTADQMQKNLLDGMA